MTCPHYHLMRPFTPKLQSEQNLWNWATTFFVTHDPALFLVSCLWWSEDWQNGISEILFVGSWELKIYHLSGQDWLPTSFRIVYDIHEPWYYLRAILPQFKKSNFYLSQNIGSFCKYWLQEIGQSIETNTLLFLWIIFHEIWHCIDRKQPYIQTSSSFRSKLCKQTPSVCDWVKEMPRQSRTENVILYLGKFLLTRPRKVVIYKILSRLLSWKFQ